MSAASRPRLVLVAEAKLAVALPLDGFLPAAFLLARDGASAMAIDGGAVNLPLASKAAPMMKFTSSAVYPGSQCVFSGTWQ